MGSIFMARPGSILFLLNDQPTSSMTTITCTTSAHATKRCGAA
jgi:hypothetical protein